MENPTRATEGDQTSAATYRIRVAEVLGDEWTERAHGLTVSVRRSENGGSFTELIGELVDQAELMGVLDALYAHGARLLSVEHIETDGLRVIPRTSGT